MISGYMLYVFLLIMDARVYVILKFSLLSCYLSNIMPCSDTEQWPDNNQDPVCDTGVITAIILITLHFW